MEYASIARALEISTADVRLIIQKLKDRYRQEGSGLQIVELGEACQMCTRPEEYEYLIRIARQPKKPVLTETLLETLSIVAYRQPVTRMEIEKIRGVSSGHAINRLVDYNLIEEKGRLDAPGRPILFGTTEEFLRRFGLPGTGELPLPDPQQIEQFRAEVQEEVHQEH